MPYVNGRQRVDRLEEARRHLDGIQPRRAGYLREHEHDADALADVLQRDRQRVDDAEVGERGHGRGEEQRRRVDGLHADEQHARAADHRLQHGQRRQEREAAQVALRDGEVADALAVHLLFHDDEQHEGADPEREVHEQRRHGRAVGVQRVELLGDQASVGDPMKSAIFGRVEAVLAERLHEGVGLAQGHDVGMHGVQALLQALQEAVGLAERFFAPWQAWRTAGPARAKSGRSSERWFDTAPLKDAAVADSWDRLWLIAGTVVPNSVVGVRLRLLGGGLHGGVERASRLRTPIGTALPPGRSAA